MSICGYGWADGRTDGQTHIVIIMQIQGSCNTGSNMSNMTCYRIVLKLTLYLAISPDTVLYGLRSL